MASGPIILYDKRHLFSLYSNLVSAIQHVHFVLRDYV